MLCFRVKCIDSGRSTQHQMLRMCVKVNARQHTIFLMLKNQLIVHDTSTTDNTHTALAHCEATTEKGAARPIKIHCHNLVICLNVSAEFIYSNFIYSKFIAY